MRRRSIVRFAAGRYFTSQEAADSVDVAVVSFGLGSLVGHGDPAKALGQTVTIRGHALRVVGVFASAGGERVSRVFAPLELATRLLAPTPRPRAPTLVLQARQVEDVRAVRAGVEAWLTARFGADWQAMATVRAQSQRVEQAERAILVFKLFFGSVTGIALLVGGIGIMNVLLSSVIERTREIGIRKAIGARRRDLLAQFLLESITIAGTGSVVGTVVGYAGAFAVTAYMRRKLEAPVYAAFSWSTLLVSAALAIVIGVRVRDLPGAPRGPPLARRSDPARVVTPAVGFPPGVAPPDRRPASSPHPSTRRGAPDAAHR